MSRYRLLLRIGGMSCSIGIIKFYLWCTEIHRKEDSSIYRVINTIEDINNAPKRGIPGIYPGDERIKSAKSSLSLPPGTNDNDDRVQKEAFRFVVY